jgi:hypothetical protein
MKLAVLGSALAAVVGCTLIPLQTAVAAPRSPVAGIAFDKAEADSFDTIDVAFGGKQHPRLPAVSADGTLFADFEDTAGGPMMPMPYDLVVRKVGTDKIVERVTLLSFDEAEAAAKTMGDDGKWATPALTKLLAARGAKLLARLHGFHSLTKIELPGSSRDQPAKIGSLVLDPSLLDLHDAQGNLLHSVELPDFHTKDPDCAYNPMMRWAYRDDATIYVEASYQYRDGCEPPPVYVLGWSTDPAKADPAALCHNVIVAQFDGVPDLPTTTNLDDLTVIVAKARQLDLTDVQATVSRDGKSAWGSVIIEGFVRASDVLVKTPKGWQLAAVAWTQDVENDYAKREAKAGHLKPERVPGDPGDASLRAAFAKLTTAGVDAAATARPDLVAIGSGPDERTVGGHDLARAWNAFWKGHVTIVASTAHATPSGTTGWVSASIELAKPGYKMPFLVFAVFDKTAAGSWSLVHIHFAI